MSDAAVLTLPVDQSTRTANLLDGLGARRKAAILVLSLGLEEAAPIVSELTELELEELSIEVARMGVVDPEVSAAVVSEFHSLLFDEGHGQGGMQAAHTLLRASVGFERAGEITERVLANFVSAPFAGLAHLDPRQVVSMLSDEHPQTVALVIAHLPAGLGSNILAGLSRDLQADVARRIAVMDRTSPEIIRQVEDGIERRLASLGVASKLSAVGGLRPLVDIINRADRGTERMILEGLEKIDPTLAETVRAQMFMFEDIVSLDDRAIQLILRQVQTSELSVALKGVPDPVRNKVMNNMSERAALNLTEEMENIGRVRLNAVEEAQAAIVRAIRQLEASGELEISRGGDDDAFVA